MVASFTYPEQGGNHFSRIILRDILVLRAPATGAGTAEKLGGDDGFNAVLAVTDNQVQKLFWANKHGEWHFELRPTTDAADSPENVESAHSLLVEGVRPKQLDDAASPSFRKATDD